MGFSRQEYWNGLSCLPPRIFLTQGVNLCLKSPTLADSMQRHLLFQTFRKTKSEILGASRNHCSLFASNEAALGTNPLENYDERWGNSFCMDVIVGLLCGKTRGVYLSFLKTTLVNAVCILKA